MRRRGLYAGFEPLFAAAIRKMPTKEAGRK
jgi:hypothetical protein